MLALQEERLVAENRWMDPEYIEEDSKSLGRASPKLFTLSTLMQAYSFSIIGHNDPISNPDAAMFRDVAERVDFVRAYWRRISEVFGGIWLPMSAQPGQPTLTDGEWQEYLLLKRDQRNVAFQAVFLLAVG